MQECIKFTDAQFLFDLETMNYGLEEKIDPLEIIKKLLEEKEEIYERKADKKIFKNIDTYILLFMSVLLDNDLVQLTNFDESTKTAEFKYLDLTGLDDYRYYINKINDYYCDKKFKTIKIEIEKFKLKAGEEKAKDYNFFYELAAYFVYLMKIEKLDVASSLEEYLEEKNNEVLRNRAKYFIKLYNNRVEDLPCNNKALS